MKLILGEHNELKETIEANASNVWLTNDLPKKEEGRGKTKEEE
jgi:hypothetical protein